MMHPSKFRLKIYLYLHCLEFRLDYGWSLENLMPAKVQLVVSMDSTTLMSA